MKIMIKKLLFFTAIILLNISLKAQPVWIQQNTNFTDLTTAIAVDQVSVVDENIVWVKGFNGSGTGGELKVFSRTSDGGANWTAGHFTQFATNELPYVLAASSDTSAYMVVMDSITPSTSFWATSNGGTTWVKKTSMFNGTNSFVDGVRFWNTLKGFCYGDPDGGMFEIYTTTDGGITWTKNTNAPAPSPSTEYGYNGVECSATVSGGIAFIMTDHGRVLRTTDYGATWAPTATAPFTSVVYGSNKIYASSANYIICATFVTATSTWTWKYTTNGGVNWNAYAPSAPFYDYAMCYVPGTVNMFVATSPDINTIMGVAYSIDGGLSWTDYLNTLLQPAGSNIQCLGVGYASQQVGWVGNYDQSGAVNSILKFQDVTAGANLLNTVNGNDVNIFPNPSNGVVNFSVNGPNDENISVNVYDLVGQLVFSENMNVNGLKTTSYDFSSYAKGMYIVHLKSGNDFKTQKFVIN